jgi:hypothetical protein
MLTYRAFFLPHIDTDLFFRLGPGTIEVYSSWIWLSVLINTEAKLSLSVQMLVLDASKQPGRAGTCAVEFRSYTLLLESEIMLEEMRISYG